MQMFSWHYKIVFFVPIYKRMFLLCCFTFDWFPRMYLNMNVVLIYLSIFYLRQFIYDCIICPELDTIVSVYADMINQCFLHAG